MDNIILSINYLILLFYCVEQFKNFNEYCKFSIFVISLKEQFNSSNFLKLSKHNILTIFI